MTVLLERFIEFMDEVPFLTLVAVGLAASAPLALVHELGHGLAALRRVSGRVTVCVGADPPAWRGGIGRLEFRLNPVILPWRMHAACVFDASRVSVGDVLVISLAGPVASAVTAGACFAALPLLGGVVHTVVVLVGLEAAATAVVCSIPMTLAERRRGGVRFASDGMVALQALRVRAFDR